MERGPQRRLMAPNDGYNALSLPPIASRATVPIKGMLHANRVIEINNLKKDIFAVFVEVPTIRNG